MRNLLIWLLGLLMIGVLSFFCFNNKADIVKDKLLQKADNLYASEQMDWVDSRLKGDGFETKRILILEGVAPSESLKNRAEVMAKHIVGIARVENNLKVSDAVNIIKKPPMIVEDMIKSEPKIEENIKDKKIPSPFIFKASKDKSGVVTLNGYVSTKEARVSLVEKAGELFGAVNVIDSLSVSMGAPDKWEESAALGLEKLNVVDAGTLLLEDEKFIFSGAMDSRAQAEVLEKNIKNSLDSTYQAKLDIKILDSLRKQEKRPSKEEKEMRKSPQECQASFKQAMAKEKIHFNYNKATIKESSFKLLDKIVQIAKACPKDKIIIGGHTDSIGSYDYNKLLSQKRANSVKAYMVKKGVDKQRLKAIGYGERKPIADNMHKEGRAINRRIEFSIEGGAS